MEGVWNLECLLSIFRFAMQKLSAWSTSKQEIHVLRACVSMEIYWKQIRRLAEHIWSCCNVNRNTIRCIHVAWLLSSYTAPDILIFIRWRIGWDFVIVELRLNWPTQLSCGCLFFSFVLLLVIVAGMDFWWFVVFDMVGSRRMDVYGLDTESVCHIAGSICGCYTTGYLSKHNVNQTSQITSCRRMGSILCYLFAPTGWSNKKS